MVTKNDNAVSDITLRINEHKTEIANLIESSLPENYKIGEIAISDGKIIFDITEKDSSTVLYKLYFDFVSDNEGKFVCKTNDFVFYYSIEKQPETESSTPESELVTNAEFITKIENGLPKAS